MQFTGSIMFLFTVFLMPGGPEPSQPAKDLTGVDNSMFTTRDEHALPTITSLVRNNKRTDTENSRL